MIKRIIQTFISAIITLICTIVISIIYIKKAIQMYKRNIFLKHNSSYIDMYSVEGRHRIYEYKFNSNVYEEQVACNIMLLSEPVTYINELNLTSIQMKQIVNTAKNIKESIKVM